MDERCAKALRQQRLAWLRGHESLEQVAKDAADERRSSWAFGAIVQMAPLPQAVGPEAGLKGRVEMSLHLHTAWGLRKNRLKRQH